MDADAISGAPHAKIIAEGFLIQRAGTDPSTGERWKPEWITIDKCPRHIRDQWFAEKQDQSITAHGDKTNELKRSSCATPENDVADGPSNSATSPKPCWSSASTKGSGSSPKRRRICSNGHEQPFWGVVDRSMSTISQGLTDPLSLSPSSRPWPVVVQRDDVSSEVSLSERLHDSTLIPKLPGILVQVKHSSGEYEGIYGVLVSVSQPKARVRFLNTEPGAIEESVDLLVQHLFPVLPSEEDQYALILTGKYQGHVAKLREDEGDGWFVSIGKEFFVIDAEALALIAASEVDT